MTYFRLAGSTALIGLFAGGAVQAQVTPEEVWQNWQELSASYGQTLTTTDVSRQGDTLRVQGLTIVMDQPESEIRVTGTLDEVSFRDTGTGAVEITMSDSYPLTVEVDSDGEQSKIDLLVSSPGLVMTASGNSTDTGYDFTAPQTTITLQSVESSDPAAQTAKFDISMTGMEGRYLVKDAGNGAKTLESDVSVNLVAANLSGEPETGSFKVVYSLADLKGRSSGNLLSPAMMEDPAAALKAGFAVDAGFTYGATSFVMDFVDQGAPGNITGSASGGDFTVAMDANRLHYGGGGKDAVISITSGQIPFPVNLTYAEAAFDLLMPVSKGDAPAEFSFLTRLADLTVSEEIWALIDPGQTLPRDPATLVVDTKGTARLDVDILDQNAMAALGETPPGELHSLDINELRLDIAGAELTGTGALTFDNTDLVSFDGVPAPTGSINLQLTGGNGLLDKLVALGLVPADTAMQVRMMTAMFAKAGAAPDTLESAVEFRDKGFYVNGQRLK